MAKVLKYLKARMDLVDFIARNDLVPGSKLPREKDLVEKFNVSAISLRRALMELSEQGVIETVQGRGSYLRKRISSVPIRETVVFIDIQRAAPYGVSPFVYAVQKELDQRGIDLSFFPVSKPGANVSGAVDGAIGVFVTGWLDQEWADFLQLLPLPVVVLGSNPFVEQFHTVTYDWRQAGRMLAEHFLDQGCRRIGLINGAPDYFPAQMMDKGYRDALAVKGLGVDETAIIWPRPGEVYARIKAFLAGGKYDALLVDSGAVPHLLSWCWNHQPVVSPMMGMIAGGFSDNITIDQPGRMVKAVFNDSVEAMGVRVFHQILGGVQERVCEVIEPKLCLT